MIPIPESVNIKLLLALLHIYICSMCWTNTICQVILRLHILLKSMRSSKAIIVDLFRCIIIKVFQMLERRIMSPDFKLGGPCPEK